MICLSATIADTHGSICFQHKKGGSTLKNLASRLSVTKTLDGGTVVLNNGVTDKDRDIIIYANINRAQEAKLWYLYKKHSRFILSLGTDLFYCAIKKIKTDKGELMIQIIVIENEV